MDINTVIDSIFPSSGVDSVIVGSPVEILFDREIDESSIAGNFFVTGPETDTWSGPDLARWGMGPDGSDALQSPGLAGIVPGDFSFERINLGDTDEYTGLDVVGSGLLFRTKVIFTPTNPFTPDTVFTVYLIGDEDSADSFKTGIKPQSVFDSEHLGTGSEDLGFSGTYSDPAGVDVINLRVVASGVHRDATFEYWFDSDPSTVVGPISAGAHVFLNKGVYADFGDGMFVTDDEYTAVLKEQDPFIGSLSWTFSTGSGSIQTIPTSTSTSITGSLVPTISSVTFAVAEITPKDRTTNSILTTKRITIEFTKDVDSSTVTSERVKIMAYPVNGDPNVLTEREIYKNLTVDGKKIILDF